MAPAAPGQGSSHQEPYCYNCGMNGHWMFACPEPTREVPAGLKQWQSKHHDQGSDRSKPSRDGKGGGAVITRYPPPIHQVGPPAPYGPPPSQLPPPPPYPPAGSPLVPHGYAQPYPPPPPGYGSNYSPLGPSPPPYPQYPPVQPPPGLPPGPPPQGSYGQPHPPYPQPHYPPYPPPGYYHNGPPPPPPGSYPPGAYQPQQYPSAGPYPPPPDYHFPPTPPAQYGPPPPSTSVSPYPGNHWAPSPSGYGLPPPPPTFAPSGATSFPRPRDNRNIRDQRDHRDRRDRQNGDRGRRQNRDETQRTPNAQKDRSRPNNRDSPSTPVQNRTFPPKDAQRDHSASRKERPAKSSLPSFSMPDKGELEKEKDKGKPDISEEISFSQSDLAIVFPEKGKTKEADPVGIPLPTEYNDDPTIPPAYNAKVIKSVFFDEHNEKEFSASIRDSSDWNRLKDDPVFKFYDGMVSRRFSSSSYSYPTYTPLSPPSPSVPIKLPPRLKIDREVLNVLRGRMMDLSGESRPLRDEKEGPQLSSPHKRHLEDPERRGDREAKRAKPSPPRESSTDEHAKSKSSPRRPLKSPRPNLGRDPLELVAGESCDYGRRPASRNGHTRPSLISDDRPSPPNLRHDSGYYSGQSQDNYTSYKEKEWDHVRGRTQDWDRDYARRTDDGDRDRRLSDEDSDHQLGDRRRYQRRDSRFLSRSMSPPPRRRRSTSWKSHGSYDSYNNDSRSPQNNDLSLLDYELLGLAGPDEPVSPVKAKKRKKSRKEIEEERRKEEDDRRLEEERERREERKRFNPPPKKRKPAREVTAAFSRRW